MEQSEKALLAVPLIALVVWRFIRYMQFGTRVHRTLRPANAQWPAGIVNSGDQPPALPSVTNVSATVRVASVAGSVVVWIAGNGILYLGLFQLPFERDVPFIWPLFIVIFANFYLIPLASRSGKRWAQRFEADTSIIGGD